MLGGVCANDFIAVRPQTSLEDAHQRDFGFDNEDSHAGWSSVVGVLLLVGRVHAEAIEQDHRIGLGPGAHTT